jgi:hypothetical protein
MPKLILHFDVNKTIVCFDRAQNLTVEQTLSLLFAEQISSVWHSDYPPMTYKRYVRKHLIKGSELDVTIKKQRHTKYQELWQNLKRSAPHAFEEHLSAFQQAREVLLSHSIFPSFLNLLTYLSANQIDFSLILRTFGTDLEEVIAELAKYYPQIQFIRGKFHHQQLHIQGHIFEDIKDIQQLFLTSHCAIQDDHHYWHSHHQEKFAGAKPFPFQLDHQAISMFFDDNLEQKQIVQVIDLNLPTTTEIDLNTLIQQGLLIPVRTLAAISNENYFITHVENILRQYT